MPTRITSMEQLKTESEQGAKFFFLLLHGVRSSKDIMWDAQAKKFHTRMQGLNAKCMKHEQEKPVKITPWRKERKALLPFPVCEYSR